MVRLAARLENVNTTDIRDAIRLGCRTMSSVFNADDDDIPFFGSAVLPEAKLTFSPVHSEAHIPGRHLNALLNAEETAGIEIDEDAVEKHSKTSFFSFSGPVPLPLNRAEVGGRLVNFCPHNVREGFHALYPLIRFRNSDRAADLAERSIDALFELWNPEKGWDIRTIGGRYGLHFLKSGSFVSGLARALGPLVKLYRATGNGRVLELAVVIREKLIEECYSEDGRYNRETFGTHSHSVTCVLSSLAQLADLNSDSILMNRVKTFYDNGLWELRDFLGWSTESTSPKKVNPDRGESNNTGDIVETALILGCWGWPSYYEDAERILRCHLLPSQLRDVSFVTEPPNPDGLDGLRDVGPRHLGAFGFPAPYGHKRPDSDRVGFNMDIVGGSVASLCEAYREAVRQDAAGQRVNLLFDHETEGIEVESPYTHPSLRVRVKNPAPLWVRIPSWVDAGRLSVSGTGVQAGSGRRISGEYLFIPRPPVNRWITFDFPLTERDISLEHSTRDIRVRLKGDEVTAMDDFGQDLTFFDPID